MSVLKQMLLGQEAALQDEGSLNAVSKLEQNTAEKYTDGGDLEAVQIGSSIFGNASANDVKRSIEDTNRALSSVIEGISQENSMVSSPVTIARGLQRIGVDQYEGAINLARIGSLLKLAKLPKLVKIPATTIVFRPEGGLLINGSQVSGYDARALVTSLVLSGVLAEDQSIPILGYDLKVRPFDTELGEVSVNIAAYENLDYTSGDPGNLSGDMVYHAEFRGLTNKNDIGQIVCVPAHTQVVTSIEPLSPDYKEDGMYYLLAGETSRSSDLEISLGSYEDESSSAIKISGSNAVVYLTPIIPTKEVLTRVLNNMNKAGTAYLTALANIYSDER